MIHRTMGFQVEWVFIVCLWEIEIGSKLLDDASNFNRAIYSTSKINHNSKLDDFAKTAQIYEWNACLHIDSFWSLTSLNKINWCD